MAEDDEGLGEVLTRGLREQGYVVDLVPDGETAAAYLRFYQYEVAVLDWRMPRLSGLDLVRKLRRDGSTTGADADGPGHPGGPDRRLDAGADDYLVKPFDFGELLARIRALQRRPPVSQSPRLVSSGRSSLTRLREVLVRGSRPALHIDRAGDPGDPPAAFAGGRRSPVHRAACLGQRGGRLRLKHDRRAPGPAARQAGGRRRRIETVRGIGYRITPA